MSRGRDDDLEFAATDAAATDPGQAADSSQGAALLNGEVVAQRFVVRRLLGEGTFGAVYQADDQENPGQCAALKVLRPEHARDDAVVARFKRRELELLRRIHGNERQRNVVAALVPEIIEHRGLLVLVLEYVDGMALDEMIRQERILDLQEARTIARGLARGLAAIHASDGVHRDLKPANVRVRSDGEAVILDLGIARAMWETQTLTGTGQYLMTPLYASPEQLGGGEINAASDVYALGLILYEMLTGTVPLAGRTYQETLVARSTRNPPDPRSTGRVLDERIVDQTIGCLNRDPERRPSAAKVADALAAAAVPRKRTRRILLPAVAAGAALLAIGSAALWLRHKPATTEPVTPPPPVAVAPQPPPPKAPVEAPLSVAVAVSPQRVPSGGEVVADVTVSRPAWVALFSVGADEKVQVLFPGRADRFAKDPALVHHFPPAGREHYRVALPTGARQSRESIVAVACVEAEKCRRLVGEAPRRGREALKGDGDAAAAYEIVARRR